MNVYMGSMGDPQIAGWFIMENPSINGQFGDTIILGNLHIVIIINIQFWMRYLNIISAKTTK